MIATAAAEDLTRFTPVDPLAIAVRTISRALSGLGVNPYTLGEPLSYNTIGAWMESHHTNEWAGEISVCWTVERIDGRIVILATASNPTTTARLD